MTEQTASEHPTRDRIVACAHAALLQGGEGETSSRRVSETARISKALVHYYFADKRALLVGIGVKCRTEIHRRGQSGEKARHGAQALDGYWEWLDVELSARDVEAAIILARSEDEFVRRAGKEGLVAFRQAHTRRVNSTLEALGLAGSRRQGLIADVLHASAIGLASGAEPIEDGTARTVVDTIWLASLRMVE